MTDETVFQERIKTLCNYIEVLRAENQSLREVLHPREPTPQSPAPPAPESPEKPSPQSPQKPAPRTIIDRLDAL